MTKSLSEKEFTNLPKPEQKKYIKEWKCTCNECDETWHYLDDVAKGIDKQIKANACSACGGGGTTEGPAQLNTENKKLELKLLVFKSCPKCKSSNVTKEAKYIRKQE